MEPKFLKLKNNVQLLLETNTSIKNISIILKKTPRSITNTIQRIKQKKEKNLNIKKIKKGRIEKLSSREKRAINRDLTKSPKKVNSRILLENNLNVSKRMLQRFLKKEGYTSKVSTKKALLNKKKALNRLNFVKEAIRNFINIALEKVIFLDESTIQRRHSSRKEYYRKKKNKTLEKELVST